VRLRIPAWSAKTEVKLNGKVLDGVAAGSYFTIERDWKLGDIVEVKFDMPVVAHTLDHHVAFTRGPVLLARDSRFADGDLTEPFRHGIKDGQIMPTFAPVRTPSGVTYISAPGHTTGNCIVAVETDGLFYLIHGDLTYTDVALYENKLSVVYEDKAAARETLDRVRAFIQARPTVYLSTHCPEGYESLELKRVMKL